MFTGKDRDGTNLQSFAVSNYSLVKKIKGSENHVGYPLHKLSFGKRDGSEITKIEMCDSRPYGPELVLADDEEIIGIFGTNSNPYID